LTLSVLRCPRIAPRSPLITPHLLGLLRVTARAAFGASRFAPFVDCSSLDACVTAWLGLLRASLSTPCAAHGLRRAQHLAPCTLSDCSEARIAPRLMPCARSGRGLLRDRYLTLHDELGSLLAQHLPLCTLSDFSASRLAPCSVLSVPRRS